MIPLWFVLVCIGIGLYGLAWLIRDMDQTDRRHGITSEERARQVFEAMKRKSR